MPRPTTAMHDISAALAIPGFMSPGELRWLAERASQAQVIVEIGCWQGRSTRALADHCPGVVVAVDPWKGYLNDDGTQANRLTMTLSWEQAHDAFRDHLRDHLISNHVRVWRMSSLEAAQLFVFPDDAARVDLVFIDGDHRHEAVVADIRSWLPMLSPGGILAGHDYGHPDWPGVASAVAACFPVGGFSVHESIWWVQR